MRVDERVVRRLYDRETTSLESFVPALRARGCFVVRKEFPEVDFLIAPGKPVTPVIGFAVPTPAGQPQQMQMHQGAPVPGFSARPFLVRVSLESYDLLAPSVRFLDPASERPLSIQEMNPAIHITESGVIAQVLIDGHPATKLPFLCMRGIREFHEHPEHTGDDWLLYRKKAGLFTTIHTVLRTCVEFPNPCLAVNLMVTKSNVMFGLQEVTHATP